MVQVKNEIISEPSSPETGMLLLAHFPLLFPSGARIDAVTRCVLACTV
jgi:hypothetical protein